MATSFPSKMEYTSNSSSSSQFIATCCGPIVTTWDFNENQDIISNKYSTFQPCRAKRSNSRSNDIDSNFIVQDIAWNHNGHVIASCCSNLSKRNTINNPDNHDVILTNANTGIKLDSFSSFKKNFSDSTSNVDDEMKKSSHHCTSISFGGRSRYLSVSSNNGTVAIWDLKKKSRVRLFSNINNQTHYKLSNSPIPISKACFDPTDKYVAALSNSPYDSALRIYNLRESKLYATHCKESKTSSLSRHHGGGVSMTFSCIEKHQVAVGMNDGTFMVWDYTSPSPTSLISYFENRHDHTVTELAFSPMNKFLLASSSLDGTIAFHDISSQNTIQSIKPNYSNYRPSNNILNDSENVGITCLALHSGGVTCAAGTTSGHVIFYDLRKANNELPPLLIHDASPDNCLAGDNNESFPQRYPVKSLQFQNQLAASSGTKTLSSLSPSVITKMPMNTFHEKKNNENGNELESHFNLKPKSLQINESEEKVPLISTSKATRDSDITQNKIFTEEYETSSMTRDDSDRKIQPLDIIDSLDLHYTNSPNKSQISTYIDKGHDKIKDTIPLQSRNKTPVTYDTLFENNGVKSCSSNHTSPPFYKPIHPPSTPISPEAVQSFKKEFAFLESFQKKNSPTKKNGKKNKKRGPNCSPRNSNGHLSDQSDQSITEQNKYTNVAKSSMQTKYQSSLLSDFSSLNVKNTSMPVKSHYQFHSDDEGKRKNNNQLMSTLSSPFASQKLDNSVLQSHISKSKENMIENTSYRSIDNIIFKKDNNMNVSNDNESIDSDGNNLNVPFPIDKFQTMVNEAINDLKDDFEFSIQNLHVEILRQFQFQSDMLNNLFKKQEEKLEILMNENQALREENERLKRVNAR